MNIIRTMPSVIIRQYEYHLPRQIPNPPINESLEEDHYRRYQNESISKMEKALSEHHDDVANAMLFTYCKSPDTIDIDNAYTIIYNPVDLKLYEWDYESKLWICCDEMKKYKGKSPSVYFFDDLWIRYKNIRSTLSRKIHESNDETFKNNGEITMKGITILMRKLKLMTFKKRCLA